MIYCIKAPHEIGGAINLPSSKSISNRVLIIQHLSQSSDTINNLSNCDDTNVMAATFRDDPHTVNIMAAGTAMRFLTAYLSIAVGKTHIITGTERMCNRPISILVTALQKLGANIEYMEKEGFPPLLIQGQKMEGGELSLSGNISSQYISALLMIAPYLSGGLKLILTGNIVSRPYIDLTLNLMREFGAVIQWSDDHWIKVEEGEYKSRSFTVENDWSAASYWYEMVALSDQGKINLPGLRADSSQGDSIVRYFFEKIGVHTEFNENGIILEKRPIEIRNLTIDFVNQPDLAQTFIVTAALLNLPFHFTGLQSLKIKETDRIAAMITEMRKIGFIIEEKEKGSLYWEGKRCETHLDNAIETYEDHRMAMAFAPTSIKLKSILISNPEVVSKSYPNYWEDLRLQNFNIIQKINS
jgi:3-phosphoshikimate 1-carboxyvinyltransferase